MKISMGIPGKRKLERINDTNGYGYATTEMVKALRSLGHEVSQNDPSADVEIWFDQPRHWNFSDGPYKIGYHPWESTKLHSDWVKTMNECDEIWTPSPIIADWYKRYNGIERPVYVYEHGVSSEWEPIVRTHSKPDTFKFLHVGAESLRKGGYDVIRAFRAAFPKGDEPVELTLKMISTGWEFPKFGRLNVVNRTMSLESLVQLYHDHHVFVYPSWGEGFGLTPLQAMATGMPTITVGDWAPYRDFLDSYLTIDAELVDSPWQDVHPGKMFRPDFDQLVDTMRYSYENYRPLVRRQLDMVMEMDEYYDWTTLTETAFSALSQRLENL
jgi:glycosyltransferase involved in cell wall biosynthesis